MTTEIKVPALPESVSDATVAQWYKKEGEYIAADENLIDLETDKVMLEVPSAVSGVVEKILQPEGSVVAADTVLAIVREGEAPAVSNDAAPANDAPVSEAPAAASAPADASSNDDAALQALSPAVRQLVSENNVDIAQVKGTGKHGAVTKADVEKHLGGGVSAAAPAPVAGSRTEERVPMSRLRARVAERLLAVKHETAMLTTFNEVDMSAVMDLRKQYKDRFEKAHDTRLGFMSFFVKASIEALKRFPAVNAYIDGSDIVYHNFCDVGIAVGSERGLVVPILRNAEGMSMADMEKQIRDFGARAQTGKITIDEMTGGTFTITNGGTFGSMLSTPIINAPQSAILGMHNIVERAMVVNGEIVARPVMYLALSYDHRIVDGREAVQFLVTIKEMLEDPARLVLEV